MQRFARQQYDALKLYRPLPSVRRLHELDLTSLYILLITGSNQAGKTLTAGERIASLVRGKIPGIKPGIILCVGKDSSHIGQTQWAKLVNPGAFEIIRDEETGAWRSVRTDPANPLQIDPLDLARKSEWRESPPLIPRHEIAEISWEEKKANCPKVVRLKSGWTMYWHTSQGKPRNGIQAKVVWFDEEIEGQEWLGESLARLLRYDGTLIWSCTPQAATIQLLDLHLKCEKGLPGFREFQLFVDDNPYLPEEAKKKLFEGLPEDERAVRYYGQYAILGRRIYPEYGNIHLIEQKPIPDDWMRVMVVDPGTQVAAACFAAVPPPAKEGLDPACIHVYDEIYQKNSDAEKFARLVREKIGSDRFETFIVDKRGGDQRPMGCDFTVADHYSEAFERLNIKSRRTGSKFHWGSPDTESRRLALKRWLRGSSPLLRVHSNCVNLDKELRNRYYRKDSAEMDRPDDRRPHHLVDTIEYLAAYFDDGLWYQTPQEPPRVQEGSLWAWEHLMKKRKKEEARRSADPGW